jgi:iron complex transport system ATP-binding protein
MSALLHTEALSVGYGKKAVVEGVDLRIGRGELVALIGVNGSGKSTLLRTLAGLQAPIAGRVLSNGEMLHAMAVQQRARQIAVVLTGRPQVGLLDVRTLVSLGRQPWTGRMGRLSTVDERLVDEAMDHVKVTAFATRGMDALSDGERQKVMIARALAQDTPLLLLDEPTAFLDLVNRVQVMRLLHSIAHDLGKAVLLSTHDLRSALDLADRLALVHDRRVWVGSPAEAIASGVLSAAFQGEGLVFDPLAGTLR